MRLFFFNFQLHPDVNREDPKTHDKFIRLKDAYSVIGNVATRREYDRELAVQLQYHAQSIRRSGYDAMYKQEGGFKGYD
jgi:curved DNA-binding protein CbpA